MMSMAPMSAQAAGRRGHHRHHGRSPLPIPPSIARRPHVLDSMLIAVKKRRPAAFVGARLLHQARSARAAGRGRSPRSGRASGLEQRLVIAAAEGRVVRAGPREVGSTLTPLTVPNANNPGSALGLSPTPGSSASLVQAVQTTHRITPAVNRLGIGRYNAPRTRVLVMARSRRASGLARGQQIALARSRPARPRCSP